MMGNKGARAPGVPGRRFRILKGRLARRGVSAFIHSLIEGSPAADALKRQDWLYRHRHQQ